MSDQPDLRDLLTKVYLDILQNGEEAINPISGETYRRATPTAAMLDKMNKWVQMGMASGKHAEGSDFDQLREKFNRLKLAPTIPPPDTEDTQVA